MGTIVDYWIFNDYKATNQWLTKCYQVMQMHLSLLIKKKKKTLYNMFWSRAISCVSTDQCWWRWRDPSLRRQWRLRAASRCWCRWGCWKDRTEVRDKTWELCTEPTPPTWRPGNLWHENTQQSELNTDTYTHTQGISGWTKIKKCGSRTS